MPILISLSYQLRTESEARLLALEPVDYFDPLEPGETFAENAIPRFNHAFEYLDIDPKELLWTDLTVQGTTTDGRIRTQFFPDGASWLIHLTAPDGFEEIISSTQTGPGIFHIVRIHKTSGQSWIPNYNAVIEDLPDGSQQETRFDQA